MIELVGEDPRRPTELARPRGPGDLFEAHASGRLSGVAVCPSGCRVRGVSPPRGDARSLAFPGVTGGENTAVGSLAHGSPWMGRAAPPRRGPALFLEPRRHRRHHGMASEGASVRRGPASVGDLISRSTPGVIDQARGPRSLVRRRAVMPEHDEVNLTE